MRELRMLGSVRGVLSNGYPYRDPLGPRPSLGRAIGCAEGRNPECGIREVAAAQIGASALLTGCRFFVTFDHIQIRN